MKIIFLLFHLTGYFFSLSLHAQSWSSVGNGISYEIYDVESFNNELYVGAMGSGSLCFFKWDGNNWSTLGMWTSNINYLRIHSLKEYNHELYVSGYFDKVDDTLCTNIVRWDGTNWTTVGDGLDDTGWSMCVYNNDLCVVGLFNIAGNNVSHGLAKWDGSNWSPIGSGINFNSGSSLFASCVYNNDLYVGGNYIMIDSIANFFVSKWDGSSWSTLGSGLGLNTVVFAMAVYQGELYVAGNFTEVLHVTYCNHIAKWNGSNWSCVGDGISGNVNALAVYNGDLYAAGYFDSAGTTPANNIARWNGSQWFPLGSGTQLGQPVFTLDTFQGSLYVAPCSMAGGIPVQGIAKWEMPVSINEIPKPIINVQVYFDHSNSFLIIEFNESLKDANIEITDVWGQVKYSQYHRKIFDGEKERIDKSILNRSNMNFVNIYSKDRRFNKKILVVD